MITQSNYSICMHGWDSIAFFLKIRKLWLQVIVLFPISTNSTWKFLNTIMKSSNFKDNGIMLCKIHVILNSFLQSTILHGIKYFTIFSAFYLRVIQTRENKMHDLYNINTHTANLCPLNILEVFWTFFKTILLSIFGEVN